MDYIKEFILKTLSQYVEGVNEKTLKVGFNDGVEIRNLTLRTDFVNQMLQGKGVDARLEYGRIGRVRFVYTALPGIVTMQVDGLDLRLRPNFTGTAIRKICTTLGELQDELDDSPIVASPASALPPCRFPCPSPIYPQCAVPAEPDVHDTFSRRLPPHRVPRPPPFVRRARYVPAEAPVAHLVPAQEGEPCLSSCPVALPNLPKCELQMPSLSLEAPSLSPICENVCELIEGCTDTLAKIVTPAHENFGDVPVASYQICPRPALREQPLRHAYLLPPIEDQTWLGFRRTPVYVQPPQAVPVSSPLLTPSSPELGPVGLPPGCILRPVIDGSPRSLRPAAHQAPLIVPQM
ncbi:amine-terminal region of a tm vesicle-mediated sorter [Cystoisospora suis]|uniref:Amine-terminal region of a tm vesicle-mediated sorter n=1 Tax=Cystoisospora suis TaxID=483139 RepID=A0A2C6KII4_9APIC|nr:amine-terminal region of a tm vesicle-mediated sorter [Cystoisospora suis]